MNSGHPLFLRASANCSELLNDIKHIQYSENFQGKTVFSGQAQVAQESCIVKNIFHTVKHFRAHFVLQGKRKLLKNPEFKKCIQ